MELHVRRRQRLKWKYRISLTRFYVYRYMQLVTSSEHMHDVNKKFSIQVSVHCNMVLNLCQNSRIQSLQITHCNAMQLSACDYDDPYHSGL